MVETKKFFVFTEDFILEAEYYKSIQKRSEAVLITHPHPDYGGNMNNNVVSAIFSELIKENISCLRFNFSGVGKSRKKKNYKNDRIPEVQACIDYLINEQNTQTIIICGYSFGAAVGCSAVNYSDKVKGFIAISFPWDFMGQKYKRLSQTDKPKYFLQGDQDDIAVYQNFQKHYKDYQEPKDYVIIQGADHFYWGYEDNIANIVLQTYQKLT